MRGCGVTTYAGAQQQSSDACCTFSARQVVVTVVGGVPPPNACTLRSRSVLQQPAAPQLFFTSEHERVVELAVGEATGGC